MLVALVALLVVILLLLLAIFVRLGGPPAPVDRDAVPDAARRELPQRALTEKTAEDLASAMVAGDGVDFEVVFGRRQHAIAVRFLIVPLQPLARPSAAPGQLETRKWLVWQSLTERGVVVSLPIHSRPVAEDLGLRETAAEDVLYRLAKAYSRLTTGP